MTEVPDGCLSCNTDAVRALLVSRGIDPARFLLVPRPRHAWPGLLPPCEVCDATYLIEPASITEGR